MRAREAGQEPAEAAADHVRGYLSGSPASPGRSEQRVHALRPIFSSFVDAGAPTQGSSQFGGAVIAGAKEVERSAGTRREAECRSSSTPKAIDLRMAGGRDFAPASAGVQEKRATHRKRTSCLVSLESRQHAEFVGRVVGVVRRCARRQGRPTRQGRVDETAIVWESGSGGAGPL